MRSRSTRLAVAGATVLLAGGCGTVSRGPAPSELLRASRNAREAELNHKWQNHTLAELLLGFGQPQLLLDIPGGGNPPGFVLVYRRDETSGCLDTFAVMTGRQILVRLYQCR